MGSQSSDDGHSMWSRPFTFGKLQVRVEEEWGLGIGGTVWEGGVLLAQYLSSPAFTAGKYRGSRCIEIGAGITGLPSIAAAHLNSFSQIVVTDIEECFDALVENLGANLPPTCQLRSLATPGIAPTQHVKSEHCNGAVGGWDVPKSVLDTLRTASLSEHPSTNGGSKAFAPLASGTSRGRPPPEDITRDSTHSASNLSRNSGSNTPEGMSSSWEAEEDVGEGKGAEVMPATTADRGLGGCNSAPCHDGDSKQEEPEEGRDGRDGERPSMEVVVQVLDWKDSVAHLRPPFGVLLVADVVYIAELMEPLLECMHALADEDTLVLFAYYERSATAGSVFWGLLPAYFTHAKIPEKSYGAQPHADNLGLFQLRKVPR